MQYSPVAVLLLALFIMTASTDSFAAVPHRRRQKDNKWLVVDFDGTCTEGDTTGLLPKLAAKLSGTNVDERVQDFSVFVDEYFRLYNAAKERMSPETSSLEQALDSLDEASNLVTQHVSDSGVLKGLNVSNDEMLELIQSDEQVQDHAKLQPDCINVLSRQRANEWQLGILSINWCPALIHATVIHPLEKDNHLKSNIPIWSNTVDSNGVVSLQVPGAIAKRHYVAKLRPTSFVVYVGDSSTDLLALIEADLGILIGDCESAVATAKQWGVQVKPLTQRSDVLVNTCNVLWKAENWLEIDRALKDISM